jgi:hypothetical protein
MFSASLSQIGTSSLEWSKSEIFIPLFLLGTLSVIVGVFMEREGLPDQVVAWGWTILIWGLAIELFASIGQLAIDGEIGNRQRSEIVTLEGVSNAQRGRIIELDAKTAAAESDAGKANERAGEAESDAAKANKETAMINERAAQLQGALELENKKQQGRTLTREQIKTFADHVRGKVSKVYIVSRRDLESIMFDAQIATMFREANVPIGIGGTFDGGFPFQGVRVASKTFTDLQSFVSDPIVGAFFAIGIMPDGGAPQGVVDLPNDGPVIFVGEKPLDLGLPFPLPAIPAK